MSARYRLLMAATINGTKYPKDAHVVLDERQSNWLASQGVIAKQGVSAARQQGAAAQGMPARRTGGCGCGR